MVHFVLFCLHMWYSSFAIRKKNLFLYFTVFKGPLSAADPHYITLGLKMNELLKD